MMFCFLPWIMKSFHSEVSNFHNWVKCQNKFKITYVIIVEAITVQLQWLEHLWDHENIFETGVARAKEC